VFDHVFLTVNEWMTAGILLAAAGCFLWGMISVALSPCHMAAIPLMVSYVAGQDRALTPRHAVQYALAFTSGLFITIAVVGVICSLLGWMLGDIGPYWTIFVGAVLIWVALDMVGVTACALGGGLVSRLKCQGRSGAFVLGLAYGALSGSCTFGFIAPILALITVQQEVARGMLFILLFGLGHALPVAVFGSSITLVRRVLDNDSFQQGSVWFKRVAGTAIGILGAYLIVKPFLGA
jgi:cytochrome c-type biogenesis protein